jgi:hypothetical protein
MDRTVASRIVDARRPARARNGVAASTIALVISGALAASCNKRIDQTEGFEQRSSAIAAEIANILGFESTAGWRAPVTLASSTTHSQGARSLAVTVNGSTEVTSLDLSSMGSIASSFSFDLRLPQTVSWGDTHLVIVAPSLGISRLDLGTRSLVGKPANSFQTYTFSVPPAIEAALEGTYSDLEFKVVINAPAASSPYLLDNLNVGPTGATPSTQQTTSFPLPDGVRRRDVAVAANGTLKIGDGAHTVTSGGGYAPVANSGTGTSTTYYGFNAVTGSLTSRPDVTLKDGATVSGDLLTAGQIVRVGANVNGSVTGSVTEHAAFATQNLTWTVTYPPVSNGPVRLEPNQQATMAPGRYGVVSVKSGSTIFLRTGVYYIDSLQLEPQSTVQLDDAQGAVEIYVKDAFDFFRGQILNNGGPQPELLVVSFGSGTTYVEAPFRGAIVSPSGKIVLGVVTGGHIGEFLGHDVELRPGALVTQRAPAVLSQLAPTLTCVRQVSAGVFEALFGYTSPGPNREDIPIGVDNGFSPAPVGRGQPSIFFPHTYDATFAVRFNGSPLTWTLAGHKVTAQSSSPACPTTTCSPACGTGQTCVGGRCTPVCGDGLCALQEGCRTCSADCGCAAGEACFRDVCATAARCGVEWQCGSGVSFGVPVTCADCPVGQSCIGHVCL